MGLIPSTHRTVRFGPQEDMDRHACPAVAPLILLLHLPSPGKQVQTLRSNTEADNFAVNLSRCLGSMTGACRFVSIHFKAGVCFVVSHR